MTRLRISLGLPSRRFRPQRTPAEWVEIDRILREEWEAGTPANAIAKRTGLEYWEVNKRRDTLGLPLRQIKSRRKSKDTRAAEDAILRREWNAGTASDRIGEMLGIKGASVRKRARKLDLARRAPGTHPKSRASARKQEERDAIIRTEWMAGTGGKAIAEKIGLTIGAVYKRRSKLGLPGRFDRRNSPAKEPFEA